MIKIFACGINEYRGAPKLTCCRNDVKHLCEAISDAIIIEKDNVYDVAPDGEITQGEYFASLKEFCEIASDEDTLIVYHSGHGEIDESNDSYLILSDTFNPDTGIYLDKIVELLGESKAKAKVLIIDCCHSDIGSKFIPSIDKMVKENRLFSSGIEFLSACKKNEEAISVDHERSEFTKFICDALRNRSIIRGKFLYLNDLQALVSVYAKNYNKKHEGETQTPVYRSSMIGTVAFPAKNAKNHMPQESRNVCHRDFDILDIIISPKRSPNGSWRKHINAKVVMKCGINESGIVSLTDKIIKCLDDNLIYFESKKDYLIKNHPLEIVNIVYFNDYIDYESNNSAYISTWTLDRYVDGNWHRKNTINELKAGVMSYKANSLYQHYREERLNNTFTDEELVDFCKTKVKTVCEETEIYKKAYLEYKLGEVSFDDLCELAATIYAKLKPVYEECDDCSFALPFSNYKDFLEVSMSLIIEARGVLFCGCNAKANGENNFKNILDLEWTKYYQVFKAWDEMADTIEE